MDCPIYGNTVAKQDLDLIQDYRSAIARSQAADAIHASLRDATEALSIALNFGADSRTVQDKIRKTLFKLRQALDAFEPSAN